ncbi:MAG: protein translocase subunit SecD [Alistipes sp.]|nr:protein translocase subunit SecD [Alistipes sp.]
MQSKGVIKLLAVLLALACIFQLSFTFVTRSVERQAAKEENPEAYLAAKWDEVVYNLGVTKYTYKECKERELNLGLDLKGGMNVMLEIKAADVVTAHAGRVGDVALDTHNPNYDRFQQAIAEASSESDPNKFVDKFIATYGDDVCEVFEKTGDNANYNDDKNKLAADLKELIESSVNTSFNVLKSRIDILGVTQPNIQLVTGTNRISVELPGVKEPDRVRNMLSTTAALEFWQVYDNLAGVSDAFYAADDIIYAKQAAELAGDEEALAALNRRPLTSLIQFDMRPPYVAVAEKQNLTTISEYLAMPEVARLFPADMALRWSNKSTSNSDKGWFQLYALKGANGRLQPAMTGDGITNARAQAQSAQHGGGFEVSMIMDGPAANRWGEITGANVGKLIAIVLDNYVYSAPVVNGRIDGGQSSISGHFSVTEAQDLASVLNAGKAPAPATIVHSEVVGPSLGQKSITDGVWSFLLAFVLVLLYMGFFYKTAGWLADVALIFNVLLLMGVLVSFGAVLTLPGIAGIVLTMGMAVDANVIIFERVKEELRGGKGLALAIKDGFSNAYSAIIDGNLTTIITGIVLFVFGSGPVKGFATTLIIGIITSLFCSIFITRLLLEAVSARRGKVSFSRKSTENFLSNVKFSFIDKRKYSYIISGVLVVISVISLMFHGLNQGIEFTGGRTYVIGFDQNVDVEQVRQSLEEEFSASGDAALSSLEVKQFGGENQVRVATQHLYDRTDEEANNEVDQMMFNAVKGFYADADFDYTHFKTDGSDKLGIISSEQVGPSIASEMTRNSILAVLFSLVAIGLYIAIRFKKWQWATGATLGLAHNAILVIGLFSLLYSIMPFNLEVNQAFIAAILTIIGYSINDTVVIFDRIREYIGLYPKRNIKSNIDNAICATLSRTINTSGTTLVTLLAIFIFGGETIRGFVFALILGVIIGTYTSVFIATPIAYDLQKKKAEASKQTQPEA